MPAELILLLIRPFSPVGRYRHGCDPPALSTRFSFLKRALNDDPPAGCPFIRFPPSICSQRRRIIELFFQFLRHTTRQSGSRKSASLRFGEERKREKVMKSQSCCSFLPPKTATGSLITSWGRYRHGCDPPDGNRQWNASGHPFAYTPESRRSHYRDLYWFSLSYLSCPEHSLDFYRSTIISGDGVLSHRSRRCADPMKADTTSTPHRLNRQIAPGGK
jgi:hypothetical protein